MWTRLALAADGKEHTDSSAAESIEHTPDKTTNSLFSIRCTDGTEYAIRPSAGPCRAYSNSFTRSFCARV